MSEEKDEMESEEESENIRYMKQDNEKPRGIIVRSDQYMKLALSKHRQEGVLKEARKYRMEEVKRKRKEEQKRELEKAEVKIDIQESNNMNEKIEELFPKNSCFDDNHTVNTNENEV